MTDKCCYGKLVQHHAEIEEHVWHFEDQGRFVTQIVDLTQQIMEMLFLWTSKTRPQLEYNFRIEEYLDDDRASGSENYHYVLIDKI